MSQLSFTRAKGAQGAVRVAQRANVGGADAARRPRERPALSHLYRIRHHASINRAHHAWRWFRRIISTRQRARGVFGGGGAHASHARVGGPARVLEMNSHSCVFFKPRARALGARRERSIVSIVGIVRRHARVVVVVVQCASRRAVRRARAPLFASTTVRELNASHPPPCSPPRSRARANAR